MAAEMKLRVAASFFIALAAVMLVAIGGFDRDGPKVETPAHATEEFAAKEPSVGKVEKNAPAGQRQMLLPDSSGMALTISAPVLTLVGFLEQKFSGVGVVPYESVKGAILTSRDVERQFNVDNKDLTADQRARLDAMVQASVAERKRTYERMESLRIAALVRSVQSGRFVAIECNVPPTEGSESARSKFWKDNMENALNVARQRVGLPEADWRYSMGSYSACHDGIPRKVVTWYTRYDEPEFFALELENVSIRRRHKQQYAEFFASLR